MENWGLAWLTSRGWTTRKVQRQKDWATLIENLWEKKTLAIPLPTHGNIMLIYAVLLHLLDHKFRLKVAAFTLKSLDATGCLFVWSSNQRKISEKCLSKVTVFVSQEGCKAMNFATIRGKGITCLPRQLLPGLVSSHQNVKKLLTLRSAQLVRAWC